jgi:PIN domain nuclease of toxin-antitoxin system
VNLLLDTHVLLWWLADDPRLAAEPRSAIANGANTVVVSAASVWEVEIKKAAGKLRTGADLWGAARGGGLADLPMTTDHAREAARLPLHHRDPFDRMLVAQARIEGLTLVTADPALDAYSVAILPAGR